MQSSLWSTQVRDFAYALNHPWHFGSPPDPSATASGQSTPGLDGSFNSPDVPQTPLALRTNWSEQTSDSAGLTLSATAYGDTIEDHGPPYSEDEDLRSPVVISSRARKDLDDQRGYFTGTNGDGSESYYVSDPAEEAGGPGGVLETYNVEQARQSSHSRHISHSLDPSNTYLHDYDGQHLNVRQYGYDAHRLSRDYSFTIASPDEEMHGKAVALFDFNPENDNELPLQEGQVIWVSYRNGQGWLVAEDPKSRETGLVPEEYVRLFKHIEAAGWHDLTGEEGQDAAFDPTEDGGITSPVTTITATPEEISDPVRKASTASNGDSYPATQSSFSTSSKDLDLRTLPAGSHGAAPPEIVHQRSASQAGSLLSPVSAIMSPFSSTRPDTDIKRSADDGRRKSKDLDRRKSTDTKKDTKDISRQASKSGKRTSKGTKR